jgi:type III restriction enzyme
VVNTVTYELREIHVQTALTDRAGQLLKSIPMSLCGGERHTVANPVVQAKSLYEGSVMPVDSQIERDTTDEAIQPAITVFAKLPRVNIPTPLGNYNPDFGFVLSQRGKAAALYLVVETKGYENYAQVPERERWKIASAEAFFAALKTQHRFDVSFKRKLSRHALSAVLAEIDPSLEK